MGFGNEFRKVGRKWEDYTRRSAKYTLATAGAMFGGPAGAKAGYEIGSSFDDRKPKLQQSGTDLAKLRREAQDNGFNPLTVLRATGGQGFARDQIPMGRLSSDAFFNAFDAYQQRNPPAPEQQIRTTINSNEILGSSDLNKNGKLNAFQNLGLTDYEYVQQPFENETVQTPFGTVDHKNKSMWGIFESRHGKRIAFPWTEWEGDQMLTMGFANLFLEATHWRDKGISAFNKWWKNAPKDNLSKKQIREIVNLRKINKSYLHIPKLSTEWINSAEKALQ